MVGRDVSSQNSLHFDVFALSHWEWMDRRIFANGGLCRCFDDGEYLLRVVVPDLLVCTIIDYWHGVFEGYEEFGKY